MELELELHPDDAPRLPRLACIRAARSGRPRTARRRIVWHDTAANALWADGLALAEEAEGWRLEHLQPALPGAPPPVLERATDPARIEHRIPGPLTPVTAFEGRISTCALNVGGRPASMGVLRGTFQGAEGHAVCRILLGGDDLAVRTLALGISAAARLELPRGSLAAEALARARGMPLPPNRQGPPVVPDEVRRVEQAFGLVLGHLACVLRDRAAAAMDPLAGAEPVHQMRVAVRRLRACMAAFQPALGAPSIAQPAASLRDLGRRLAPARDWDVFITETAPAVLDALPGDPAPRQLVQAAEQRRAVSYAELRDYLKGADFRRLCLELAWAAASRAWQDTLDDDARAAMEADPRSYAARVLGKRLRKLLAASEGIETMDAPALHQLRLRAKRMRYTAEVFAPLYAGKAARRFLRRLAEVQQRLGEVNDAAAVGTVLAQLGGPEGQNSYAIGIVRGFAAARSAANRARGLKAWEKFARQPPFWR